MCCASWARRQGAQLHSGMLRPVLLQTLTRLPSLGANGVKVAPAQVGKNARPGNRAFTCRPHALG
jgi:hypothetical protein